MKTTFDILDEIYPILNVSSVTGKIDGEVSRNNKKLNSELQDIVILPLDNRRGQVIQPGIFIINCFCKKLDNGLHNETKLKEITDAVIAVLEAHNNTGNPYFYFKIFNQLLYNDNEQKNMSYVSIRINTTIQS